MWRIEVQKWSIIQTELSGIFFGIIYCTNLQQSNENYFLVYKIEILKIYIGGG
ncbi:hypothetical protein QJS04_geneDACA018485 [Acorus gramineus]|uniref:Uncharacterized protein n=1 Tax=Acorus gramineus TaxID=55184 RepID=A0AAV9AY33_ACOGR|nr:hypothetical protein QJS04_geneDACA018485 [Acorus gramineus]